MQTKRIAVVLGMLPSVAMGFAGLLPSSIPNLLTKGLSNNNNNAQQLEDELLDTIAQKGERLDSGDETAKVVDLIAKLEASPSSISRPAVAPEVYGRWRLLYTTNADTSSPIQRRAVDSQKFPIYQDILLRDEKDDRKQLVVDQVVQFAGPELHVTALASSPAYPLPELTARKSTGKVLGFNLLGVSMVGSEAAPNRPDARIDFVFDEGNFELGQSLRLPYPVPFRLPILRDWVKGWIDITYLSSRVRISRGNKGTTFVLVKEEP